MSSTDTTQTRIWGRPQIDWIVLSIAMLAAAWVLASTWERVRTRPRDRSIRVTGSAEKRIVSDLIQWAAAVQVQDMDRSAAYRRLREHVEQTVKYLVSQGIEKDEIRVSSASAHEQFETEFVGTGEERIERQVSTGFVMRQRVVVSSPDVAAVEKVSREVTQLLERGISIDSEMPRYFYTKLGELKIEMLAAASKDARARADNIVEAAGGDKIERLLSADMGVININPPNSRETSWQGNNDTTSLQKDIITIVHATFELEE